MKNRKELEENYIIERLKDTNTRAKWFYREHLQQYLEYMDDADLIEEIRKYYPHLLGEE